MTNGYNCIIVFLNSTTKEREEVKRVFIREKYRGKGTSNTLMETLKKSAKDKGYSYFKKVTVHYNAQCC